MKLNEWACYIKQDKWDEFLLRYEEFYFVKDQRVIYPEYLTRPADNGRMILRVGISSPCVNIWDGQDKNGQREVWLWNNRIGNGNKKIVLPYVQDLVKAGFIEGIE